MNLPPPLTLILALIPTLLLARPAAAADLTPPVVVVTTPVSAVTRVYSNSFHLAGRASDAGGIASVLVQVGQGDFTPATGSSNWSATVALMPGTNQVRIKALDLAGNSSRTNTRVILQVPNAPLDLGTNGAGRVTPLTNGQRLEIGRPYTLRATPRPGNLFSNWTGTMTSTNPVLSFVGASNLTVTANFVTNPFIALKGVYTGLIYDTNQIAHESSAFFTFTLASNGRFTGKLILAGTTLVGGGVFGLDLHSHTPIFTETAGALELQLTAGSDRIEGVLTNAATTSIAEGYRTTFNATFPAPYAGRHTILLSGGTNAATSPPGWGIASATISPNGMVLFKGTLADNTPVAQSVPIFIDGRFPIYLPLYNGRGSILGWLQATGDNSNSLTGALWWTRVAPGKGPFYPLGFANVVRVRAGRYRPTNQPTDLFEVFTRFEGGNLGEPFSHGATFIPPARVTISLPNTNRIALTYSASSGFLNGSFKNPATGKTTPIKAAMLQPDGFAAGFFLGTNQAGSFFLGKESSFPPFPP